MGQPKEGHEKCIFETLDNEIECVLSVKESNFNEKNVKILNMGFNYERKKGKKCLETLCVLRFL